MKKGDCILLKGSTIDEPMTIYQITANKGDKLWAYSIYIHRNMVQGLDFLNEYNNDVTDEEVDFLPKGTYERIKNEMIGFVNETHRFIMEQPTVEYTSIHVGGRYFNGYIHTVKEMVGERAKYSLFRMEPENISPYWTSDTFIENLTNSAKFVTEEAYDEVIKRYLQFVKNIKESLFYLKPIKPQ